MKSPRPSLRSQIRLRFMPKGSSGGPSALTAAVFVELGWDVSGPTKT
jgi:hypothetical protein